MSAREHDHSAPTVVTDCLAFAETSPLDADGEAPEPDRAGQIIGARYEVERLLGRGGMGAVFAAREIATGQRVAVKLLRDYARYDVHTLDRFLQESLASALIHHPNVVRALGAFHDEREGPVLILEHLEGENLAQYIARSGRIPVKKALSIAIQIASGISAAHARGVIHRDLKPANIFLQTETSQPNPCVRVLDFGIALLREYRQAANDEVMLGTLNYMAPEQLRDGNAADERTDVYSLGMTTYEMLAGRIPFEVTHQEALLNEILFSRVPALSERCPELTEDITAVVDRSLCQDPNQRYQTMIEFREVLEGLLLERRVG
jgi:eukaryotic-like serine/threonine-protein kinase